MNDLESAEKISIDIKKLERNLKQVEDINFEGKEKEVYDISNFAELREKLSQCDLVSYVKKHEGEDIFGCIEYSHGLLDALRMIHGLI